MSLTSMLKGAEVRRLFRSTFDFRAYRIDADIAAPRTVDWNNPAIGTAFDYLARFWLERRHQRVAKGPWIAENGLRILETFHGNRSAGLVQAARKTLAYAKSEHAAYMRTGTPTDGLMRAALGLAELDVVYRALVTVGIEKEPLREDIADLHAIWQVMEGGELRNLQAPLSLNPDFGPGSDLVSGADADIIANGDLIDVKTVKSPSFKRNYFDQLAGYAALHRLAGGSDFRRVGVYFARHGRLEMIGADAIYGGGHLDEFLPAFKRMAEEMFGQPEGDTYTAE